MSDSVQSFENHAKMVPAYHYVAAALLILPTLYYAYLAATDFSAERLVFLLFCVGVVMAAFFARVFPLGVQDRVIRLEERLRMEQILPDDLRGRIAEFRTEQLIGLRFASDEELADLSRRVLDQGMTDRKSIKQAVKSWRADHQRI